MEEMLKKIVALQEEKEKVDQEIESAKAKSSELENEINELKAQVFEKVKETEEFKSEGKVDKELAEGIFVTTFAKSSIGYDDEAAVIKYLSDSGRNELLTVKTTLNKKEINKAVKTDSKLKEALDSMTTTSTTEWCVVTKADNHQRMLEHIEKNTEKKGK